MGWTGYPVGKGRALEQHLSDVTVLRRSDRGPDYADGRVADRKAHTWVVAAMHDGTPLIVCVLVDGNFVKDVDESMGPVYYDCPLSFLEMAPQAPGPFAGDWRAKVRAFWRGTL